MRKAEATNSLLQFSVFFSFWSWNDSPFDGDGDLKEGDKWSIKGEWR